MSRGPERLLRAAPVCEELAFVVMLHASFDIYFTVLAYDLLLWFWSNWLRRLQRLCLFALILLYLLLLY